MPEALYCAKQGSSSVSGAYCICYDVMNVAFKIIYSIRGISSQRRRIRTLLKECESDLGELLVHTDFMASVSKSYPQLKDDKWVRGFAFLSDMTGKLNELNVQLQGKKKTLATYVHAFKGRFSLLEAQLRREDLKQFQNMAAISIDRNSHEYDQYANKISVTK
ncbi:general transcription factor II-I repeat domain-containing protein 2B-like [Arctopsyche grandis]|uniref:general transcription factor II-I repeat domain-containing protein 2B-like n=1 Tax=Arctopsyche grandis TaxID=121162 RepID=UPI00406D866E